MKIFSLMILLGLTVWGLAGCSGAGTNSTGNNANTNRTTNSANNAISSNVNHSNVNTDHSNTNASNSTGGTNASTDFMTKAAQGGMAEVELGRLASTKAQNAEVKKFGQKMVEDHSNANTELKQLAAKKNVTLPTDIGEHKADVDKLSKLTGAEFDKEYVDSMVEDHEKVVAEFQKQADGATDADLKAFAAKILPTLKMHLEMIKGIKAKMK